MVKELDSQDKKPFRKIKNKSQKITLIHRWNLLEIY